MTEDISRFIPKQAPVPPPYKHQAVTADFIVDKRRCYVASDPGTGKTRSALDAYDQLRQSGDAVSALVLAPKSILEAAWVDDCKQFTPHLSISAAFAKNRVEAFRKPADIYVTNHDATPWLAKNRELFKQCDMLVVDEATAYKNRSAQRSRALAKLIDQFTTVVLMCGTPMPNGLEDLWHQMLLIDGGERLGASFYKFRSATHSPLMTSGFCKWVEKDGARDVVVDLISDVTIRYALEECIEMPERIFRTMGVDLNQALRTAYEEMVRESVLKLEGGEVSAVHAASLVQKLLQIASGAVYESPDKYHVLDTSRYELVADLAAEREATLLPFIWKHQKDELLKALAGAGIREVAVIDGTTKDVQPIVADFQAGKYRVLLAHPKSASHGLTLTQAATTIWSSPTMELDRFIQFNGRTYRNGQKKKTEVIMISGNGTADVRAYERLQQKNDNQSDALSLLKVITGI